MWAWCRVWQCHCADTPVIADSGGRTRHFARDIDRKLKKCATVTPTGIRGMTWVDIQISTSTQLTIQGICAWSRRWWSLPLFSLWSCEAWLYLPMPSCIKCPVSMFSVYTVTAPATNMTQWPPRLPTGNWLLTLPTLSLTQSMNHWCVLKWDLK